MTQPLREEGVYRVISLFSIEAFLIKKTNIAQGGSCSADLSPPSDEVEVERQGFPFRNEFPHP